VNGELSVKYTLRGLRINNAALASPELPRRIKLLNWGDNATTRGQVKVTKRTLELLPANQRAKGFERVAIDFDHNSLPGSETYEKGKAIEIAGYGVPSIVDGDGLYLDQVEWTPAGEKYARNYKDLSPAPGLTGSGEVVFLHSAALTPNGSVYDLEFFSAKNTTNHMPEPKPITIVALSSFLGLAENATEADIQAKFKSLGSIDPKPMEDRIAALAARIDAMPATATRPDAGLLERIEALAAKISGIETAGSAALAAREKSERDQLVADASREGKVIPLSAETVAALPISALREMISKLPKGQVPVTRLSGSGETTTGNVCAFSATVQTKVKSGKSKSTAVQETIKEHPEAYREYRELGAPAI
jgi:phage I-like protein